MRQPGVVQIKALRQEWPVNIRPVNVLAKYLWLGMVAVPGLPACLRRLYFDHADIAAAADD